MLDQRTFEILNEVKDLENFYPLKQAVAKVAQHYRLDHATLLKQYKETFGDD